MSVYDEQLNAIRAARVARDEARARLHEQLIEQLKLLRAQRKAERKEVAADDATLAAIEHLRRRMNAGAETLRAVESELRALEQLQAELKRAPSQLDALNAELDAVRQALAQVQAELNN